MDVTTPVRARRQGRIGRITLDRPRALNALTLEMIHAITVALETWREDPAIHLVLLESSSDRAFCAGGDVRTIRDHVLAGRHDAVEAFFVQEYALNRTIARYPKPYVSLIDGICMGGGVGLSVHGPVRIATEHATFAMPETQLGLFPDVGGSFVLPRLRGAAGFYMGLTGARLGAADACWVGLATHFVPRAALPALADALAADGLAVLADAAAPPPPSGLAPLAGTIDSIFRLDSLDAITAALRAQGDDWSRTALAALASASPSALAWTFDLLHAGAGRTLEQCLWAETLLTHRATTHPDFAEGVRANVVDKDRQPNWQRA